MKSLLTTVIRAPRSRSFLTFLSAVRPPPKKTAVFPSILRSINRAMSSLIRHLGLRGAEILGGWDRLVDGAFPVARRDTVEATQLFVELGVAGVHDEGRAIQ